MTILEIAERFGTCAYCPPTKRYFNRTSRAAEQFEKDTRAANYQFQIDIQLAKTPSDTARATDTRSGAIYRAHRALVAEHRLAEQEILAS
jgi:hypothetical protein